MTKRNFPDWLDAYAQYSNDNFVPPQFNQWSGLSVVAGALERKVWLPWNDTFSYYPNIFVLMVSLPGAGKSTALNKAIGILQDMNARTSSLNIIPSQVTEAKFIDLMSAQTVFEYGTQMIYQSAGYYFASEASNSLKNVFGDFIACLTDFYDCPPFWEKATKKDDKITLRNVSLNLLAGSTFDYLSKLVTDDNIMGGFASRLIYVVHREKLVRKQKFQLGGTNSDVTGERKAFRNKLVEDLALIHRMSGPFVATPEFGTAWEAWYPEFEERRQSSTSEKMQSLLVRMNTNIIKLAMIYSASRSDDRKLTLEDWHRAQEAMTPIAKELPVIFREGKALDTSSQAGLMQALFKMCIDAGDTGLTTQELKTQLLLRNFPPHLVNSTVDSFERGGQFKTISLSAAGHRVKLRANPDDHF